MVLTYLSNTETLRSHGAHNYDYAIFLDPQTSQLFAFVEIESEERWNQIAASEVCQRWWAYMKDIIPTNPDNSPLSKELKEVFYLE